jgi:hypothetical protein
MSKYIISKRMAIEMLAWILGLVGTIALLDLFI